MITKEQYFQAKEHTAEHEANFEELMTRVESLLTYLDYTVPVCPNTGSQVSGSKGGSGDGGFRLDTATTGAALSSHKQAMAVDLYDPLNALDDLITDALLEQCDLYREAPQSTPHWAHLTTRAPHSGHRTFLP